jgi:hypothetical protein
VDAKRVAQSGLIGVRGRAGRRIADEVGRRTRLEPERVATLIGAYLVFSRIRNLLRMVQRYRRD